MLDAIKKVLYVGIGAVALSEEKTRTIVDELVKQGEITTQDGEKLLQELKSKFETKGKAVEDKVVGAVKEYLDIKQLENRIAALELAVAELRSKQG